MAFAAKSASIHVVSVPHSYCKIRIITKFPSGGVKRMANQKGIILMIVLIFIIVLSITAAVVIGLMTNHARIAEYQIKRIKAFYTAEAARTYVFEQLRTGTKSPPSGAETWPDVLPSEGLNGYQANVVWGDPGSGPMNTRAFNVTVDY